MVDCDLFDARIGRGVDFEFEELGQLLSAMGFAGCWITRNDNELDNSVNISRCEC